MNDQLATLAQVKATALDLAIKFGPKLLTAVVILVAGVFAGRWVARMMARGLRRFDMEPPVRQLLLRFVQVIVVGLFVIMAIQNLGVELLPLIAGIGVAGAGVALAMQGVLSNVVAGLTIIFTRPYRVGEYIAILGVEGRVETVSLFSTTLGHVDRSLVVIPNRKVVGEILHNYGTIRQVEVIVGVSYDTDLNEALAVIQEILQASRLVLKDPAPVIQVALLADFSVNIGIRPWVNVPDYAAAIGEINKTVLETFRARRIVMPFPQREIRMLGAAA